MSARFLEGEVLPVLRTLPSDTFHGLLTDPPYGLGSRQPDQHDLFRYLAGARGASRFFYSAKPSAAERTRGAPENKHPCVKPLKLTTYLARLLLPPLGHEPRRLLVPYSGSGSEVIGAALAGWSEVTGIERDASYIEVAKGRLQAWAS